MALNRDWHRAHRMPPRRGANRRDLGQAAIQAKARLRQTRRMTTEAGRWRALRSANRQNHPILPPCGAQARVGASAGPVRRLRSMPEHRNTAGLRRQSWRRAFPFGGERNLSNNR